MRTMKRAMTLVPLCLITLVGVHFAAEASAQAGQDSRSRLERFFAEQDNVELQQVPAFKVFDNLYYVGIGWVAGWLMTTDQGLILIDTGMGWQGEEKGYEPYVDHLIDGIQKLGFDPKDIKYALVTHAHFDHIGGANRIQEMYGATVGMLEGDWQLLASGGSADVRSPRRDLVLQAGDTLTLGQTTLRFSAVPGHTPGMLVIETTLYDGGKPYQAYLGSFPAVPAGPGGGEGALAEEQYVANVKLLEQMQDISIFLGMHGQNDFWERAEKIAQRQPGDPHPLVAPEAFRALVRDLPAAPVRQR